jgi:hypothetical protein
MAAHVSVANGDPVLVGDVPATFEALTERVKTVRPNSYMLTSQRAIQLQL